MAAGGKEVAALARVSVAAALGRERALGRHLKEALRIGVSPARLDEALLQLVLFAGYARVINAFRVLRELVPRPSSSPRLGSKGSLRRGERLCRRIYGPVYGRMIERMRGFHPELARWILTEGYGRVLARPALAIRDRELILVAVLAALRVPRQLESHMRGALRVGASRAEVSAMRKLGS